MNSQRQLQAPLGWIKQVKGGVEGGSGLRDSAICERGGGSGGQGRSAAPTSEGRERKKGEIKRERGGKGNKSPGGDRGLSWNFSWDKGYLDGGAGDGGRRVWGDVAVRGG